MKHEKSRVKHNYGCVYMQTAAVSIAKALDIESKGITCSARYLIWTSGRKPWPPPCWDWAKY